MMSIKENRESGIEAEMGRESGEGLVWKELRGRAIKRLAVKGARIHKCVNINNQS